MSAGRTKYSRDLWVVERDAGDARELWTGLATQPERDGVGGQEAKIY